MPSTEANPARRPWSTERVTTYSTDGPGTTNRTIAAAANRASVEAEGMPEYDPNHPGECRELRDQSPHIGGCRLLVGDVG